MKLTSALLSLLAISIVPTTAYGDREICRNKTLYRTRYKTITKNFTQRTTIKMTVTKTVTVVDDVDAEVTDPPIAVTDPPPSPMSTCPPSSIVTNVLRSCIRKPSCSRCSETTTLTQKFDCDCIGQEGGSTVFDFRMKCPGDCSCTTFTRFLPADGCTAKPIFVTAVA